MSLKKNHHFIFDFIAIAAVLGCFYLFYLGHHPLFTPDEGRYSEVAREMVASGDFITPRVNGVAFLDKPILYYWLQAAAIQLFGISEWALRLFPALLGIIGCLVTYSCGRYLFDRRTGLLSALILATTPLYFGAAHYANLDLEVAVFISSTLLFFICGVQSEGKARSFFLIAAYICSAFAVLTKGLIGLAFPAMIAGAWMFLLGRLSLLKKIHLVIGILLFAVIVLPWYILVQRANPAFLHYFFVTQQVTRFLSAAEFNNKTQFWFYAPIVLAGFFPWTIFFIQTLISHIKHCWKGRQTRAVELYLLLWVGIVFIFFSIPHSKIIGYILPIFPALALLTGNYLSDNWRITNKAGILFGTILFVLLAAALTTCLLALPYNPQINLSFLPASYLLVIAGIILFSALAAVCLLRQRTLLPLFITCFICSSACLMVVSFGATHLNQNTAKPLVTELQKILKPEDEVVNYFKFYQDTPLYLERRITLVADWDSPTVPLKDNWVRELWYSMAFQDTHEWLINENTFWQRWHGGKRVFAFVNDNYLKQFKMHTKKYFMVGKYNDIVLFSNQAIALFPSPQPSPATTNNNFPNS